MSRDPVAVVGAGLSGLAAARRLRRRGAPTVVYEKSAGLGGRLATRRVEGTRVDHGCPSIDVQPGGALSGDVGALGSDRVALSDGTTAIRSGMTRLPKAMAAGVRVERGVRVGGLVASGEHVDVMDDAGAHLLRAGRVVVTAPGPQSAELLRSAGEPARADELGGVEYAPAIVVIAGFRAARAADVAIEVGPFTRVVREDRKGRGSDGGEAVICAQLGPLESAERFDEPEETLAASLLAELADAIDADGEPGFWQLKRWRYAVAVSVAPEGIESSAGSRIHLAGDALTGVDLERVHTSGLRAAQAALASAP